MEEKPPSERMLMLGGIFWLILSIVAVLVWSYFSSEWWSAPIGLLAVYFFIESMLHSPPIGSVVTRWYYQKTTTETKHS